MKIGDRVAHRIERLGCWEEDHGRLRRRGIIVDTYRSIFSSSGAFWWVQWDDNMRLAYRESHLILADEVHLEQI
jgi:hypothetical protein